MKSKSSRENTELCKDCADAFGQLMVYGVNPERAGTVAKGIRLVMRRTQGAFQELVFEQAHMTALTARAFTVLTGRDTDDDLISHMKRMGVAAPPRKEIVPPKRCAGSQVHVYCNAWLRLNELIQQNPRKKSPERLELEMLQQLMNFYERGTFRQLEHRGADAVD